MKKTQGKLVSADRGPAIRRQTGLSLAGSHRISAGLKTSSWCQFNSVQSLSHVQLFVTPWAVARQASLSFTNPRSLLKFMSIKSVMPSNHLVLCHPLLLLLSIFPSISESALRIRWPKYWSFRFSISPSNEYSGLIFFRIDCDPEL